MKGAVYWLVVFEGLMAERCHRTLPGEREAGPNLLRKSGGGAIELSSLSARFHECIAAVLGADAYETHEWPSLHECRSLAARKYLDQGLTMKQVQTLLGHKNQEMTALYADDRGLSSAQWKRVSLLDPMKMAA